MGKILSYIFTGLMVSACTHGSVSTVPIFVDGIGEVYRYQGRANFSHQFKEADRMITEHCLKVNGGRPVIVSAQKRDLGIVSIGSGASTTTLDATATESGNSINIQGAASTQTSQSSTGLRNFNQELLYKCVTQ